MAAQITYQPNHEGIAVMVDDVEKFRVTQDDTGTYEVYLTHIDQEITEPVAYFMTMTDVRNAVALTVAVSNE